MDPIKQAWLRFLVCLFVFENFKDLRILEIGIGTNNENIVKYGWKRKT